MKKYLKNFISDLKTFIKIPSVETPAVDNKPFGEGVFQSLDFMLSLANSFGFDTKNYDNYIGEIVWGEGKDCLGILAHVDVVPVGKLEDWKFPPFSATEFEGRIYGRGTIDDKSPALVCLYALKALKDEGYVPKKQIKLILGCDEESGWECIKHYNKVAKMPDFGFSPDGDFPVLYAEKGIFHVKFAFPKSKALIAVSGGDRVNVVCDLATATFEGQIDNELLLDCGVGATNVNGLVEVQAFGKTAHGSTPKEGDNAIAKIVKYLEKAKILDSDIHGLLFLDKLGLGNLVDETGELTISPNVISNDDDNVYVTVDCRYPATIEFQKVESLFKQIGDFTVLEHQKALYNDKQGVLVQTLLKIYNEHMKTNLEPKAIGGGTYARALPIGTAFGPEFPGEPNLVHQPNESVSIENLEKQFAIYKSAIESLSGDIVIK